MHSNKDGDNWLEAIAKPLLEHLPALYPIEEWDGSMDARIEALVPAMMTQGSPGQESYGLAIKAGLFLLNESLDKSHDIAQEITNATGSYWHALMHRMEGDYSNAKYWFNDVGHHPIFSNLLQFVSEYLSVKDFADLDNEALRQKLEVLITSPEWIPCVFIDIVELQVSLVQNPIVDQWLRHIQRYEMQLLLQYCYEQSCGGSLLEAIEQK
ncbi:hypothetical protein M5X11_03760 [Paenibacillus alginolyticus]|uniref:Uncharacterized protein n=1 Tax=Paenibacillus alginolyticus TaxID=59839 RepID=A0ABT4GBG5_9BACL|nr:hypothetical protein [Paenibacillus alginolyticus]MCY9664100.1 hypothetical protein [Paenibacillus alginolyticus]MCY9693532.1 hypothetical protein [Paenibacillus alginolyticus]MEC0144435.1 hypothetical protein [Paenibacillus alginolyticus]